MKGSTKNTENQNYDVKVTRAKEVKEGEVVFDMVVNGITIYGCWYREGKSKKTGKEYAMISFPSHKGADEKYYNHVWFKIDETIQGEIVEQLQKLV